MRILYVEDNLTNVSLVKRVARHHEVISYIDGQQALDNFEKDKPDLVLMDVQLAGKITGLEVVRELRSRGHKIPIIAVTAYAMLGDRETCLKAGCDDYIAKPLPIPVLVEMIQRYDKEAEANPPKSKVAAIRKKVQETQETETPAVKKPAAKKPKHSVSEMPAVKADNGDSKAKKPEITAESDQKPDKVEKTAEEVVSAKDTPKPEESAEEPKEPETVRDEDKQTASSNSNIHSN